MDKINCEELITEIQKHEAIYDIDHREYKNLKAKAKKWKDIAHKLGTTDEICKKKWKSLRDCYMKKLKKGVENDFRFGEQLSFLKYIRRTERNSCWTNNMDATSNDETQECDSRNLENDLDVSTNYVSTNDVSTNEYLYVDVKRFESEIDPKKLIDEIKKYPAIWVNSKVLTAEIERNRAWVDICQNLYEEFNNISPAQQRDINIIFRKKWQGIRNYYRKIKTECENTNENPENYYQLYNDLSFLEESESVLLSNRQIENRLSSSSEKSDSNNDLTTGNDNMDFDDNDYWVKTEDYTEEVLIEPQYENDEKHQQYENVEKLEYDVVNVIEDEEDDDKLFLLSLVKEMKKIPKENKLDARLNILVILKKWQRQNSQNEVTDPLYNLQGRQLHLS